MNPQPKINARRLEDRGTETGKRGQINYEGRIDKMLDIIERNSMSNFIHSQKKVVFIVWLI